MNQPKRRRKRSWGTKYNHLASPDNDEAGGGGWMEAYPKTSAKTCDSDRDGGPRLGHGKELGKKHSKIFSWNDGCSSDGGSSSSSDCVIGALKVKKNDKEEEPSDQCVTKHPTWQQSNRGSGKEGGKRSFSGIDIESKRSASKRKVEEVRVKKKLDGRRPHKKHTKKTAAESIKKGSKRKSRKEDGETKHYGGGNSSSDSDSSSSSDSNSSSDSESDMSLAEVTKKAKCKIPNKEEPNRSNVKKDKVQSSKREGDHKSQRVDCDSSSSSSDDEIDRIIEEGKGKNKKPRKNLPTNTSQSSRREEMHKNRKDDGNSSSSGSESERSMEERNKEGNNKKTNEKPPNQSRFSKQEVEHKRKLQKAKVITGSAVPRKSNAPYNAPSRVIVKLAETKANQATIPEDIRSISQLQWYRLRLLQTEERTRETLKPCRVLSRGEAAKYFRNVNKSNMIGKTTVIQYLNFPNVGEGMQKCVDENSLIPFGYKSKDGLSATFNDDYLQRYLQQIRNISSASNLEATRLFLKRVFDHARDTEKNSLSQASQDLQDYYDGSSGDDADDNIGLSDKVSNNKPKVQFVECTDDDHDSDDNEKDDLDVPYTQAITFDPDDFGKVTEQSNEPIRPGDVIEYYSPIFTAGDARGRRQASVLSVNPNEETPLILSNGEVVPSNTKVKRIKVMLDAELVDHPGIYRPIYRFKLVKQGSATAADAVAMEASRFGRIMQKNVSKLKEKAQAGGFAPMDLLINIKGVNTDTPMKATLMDISSAASHRGKKPESLHSPSSNGIDDSSGKLKQNTKPSSPKKMCARGNDNKENNGTALGKEQRKRSSWSPSSPTSLGPSLASSDDSSIESTIVELARNDQKATQYESANSKPQDWAATCDSSLSSDDENNTPPKKVGRNKCGTSPNNPPSSAPRTPNSVNCDGSLETPNSLGLRKQRGSNKNPTASSIAASTGLPKSRMKLKTKPNNKVASLSSVFGKNNEDSARVDRWRPAPSSPLPEATSPATNSSRRPARRQTKGKLPADAKSSMLLLQRSSSPGSVQIVDGGKSKAISKKRSSPSYNFFSSDESDDNCHTNPDKTCNRKSKKQSPAPSGSAIGHGTSKVENNPAQGLLSAKHKDANSLGWTQGKAGWEKRSEIGGAISSGFTFRRHK